MALRVISRRFNVRYTHGRAERHHGRPGRGRRPTATRLPGSSLGEGREHSGCQFLKRVPLTPETGRQLVSGLGRGDEYKPSSSPGELRSYLSEGVWRWAWRKARESRSPRRRGLLGSLGLLRFREGRRPVEARRVRHVALLRRRLALFHLGWKHTSTPPSSYILPTEGFHPTSAS